MADNLKLEDRRKTMQAVKGKGTSLERRLFSMIAGMGLKGWKKNAGEIAGKPDVVFSTEHVAIFADGCFWHGCPHCDRMLRPQTNRKYWEKKIRRNIERDHMNNEKLCRSGWYVIRIWEHEMSHPSARKRIRSEIRKALNMEKAS